MLGGHNLTLSQGEASILPGGAVHNISTLEEGLVLVAQIDDALLEGELSQHRLRSSKFHDKYRVSQQLDAIYNELAAAKPFYREMTEAMAIRLIADIYRGESLEPATRELNSAAIWRYTDLLEQINERFEFITFQEAAELMHMSEAYFSRYFKRVTGMTFSNYLNLVKVDKAVEMILADPATPTTRLMLDCGFNTLRHFYRVFKQITGYSPTQLPADFQLGFKAATDPGRSFDPTLPTTVAY